MSTDTTTDDLHARLARVGVEIELLAPPGTTRAEVAAAIAERNGGSCRAAFAYGTEPSRLRNVRMLYHLSRSVVVLGPTGRTMCRLVDDLTIRDGFSKELSADGDFRIVSDDKRLLQLIERNTDPRRPLAEVLIPLAKLYKGAVGTDKARTRYGVSIDRRNIATALLQLTDRQRVCEVVTNVIAEDHGDRLEALLAPARDIGCTVPVEAAVHVHFDAAPFRRADRFGRLVELFTDRGDELRERYGTNPRCRHLGPQPEKLVELVRSPGFASKSWAEVEEATSGLRFSKYLDVNLKNLRHRIPGKDTVEVRILGGDIDGRAIAERIADLRRLLADEVG